MTALDTTLLNLRSLLLPCYEAFLEILYNDPYHLIVESLLASFIIWLVFIRKTVNPNMEAQNKLTTKEKEWLIETWAPEPLVPIVPPTELNIIEKVEGNYLVIRDLKVKVLNLNTFDFLGFSRLVELKEVSLAALEKYGCGSCGPRGFYGTIDLHIEFEKQIADFMGCEEAISYSDSASCVSSCIPAFAKKGDLLLVDEACCEPILTAVTLSRSTVFYFKHNDMEDLRNILESIADDDIKFRRDSLQQRRFIVVEGLYRNTGNICPLPELVSLKNEFCYRLVVDESLSFGVYGAQGRGLTDHFKIPTTDIDILTVAMDCTLASVGGVCLGTREIVDHQRLAGAGYCFSASAPPFLSAAAIAALNALKNNPSVVNKLHQVVTKLVKQLDTVNGLTRLVKKNTPIIHMVLTSKLSFTDEEFVMAKLSKAIMLRGVASSATVFTPLSTPRLQKAGHRPTLRFIAHAQLTDADIGKVATAVQAAVDEIIFNKRPEGLFSFLESP